MWGRDFHRSPSPAPHLRACQLGGLTIEDPIWKCYYRHSEPTEWGTTPRTKGQLAIIDHGGRRNRSQKRYRIGEVKTMGPIKHGKFYVKKKHQNQRTFLSSPEWPNNGEI